MKTVRLEEKKISLEQALKLAQKEPVLLLTSEGKEFLLSEADDFDREVEALRNSKVFQKFLDERSKSKIRIPLEAIEKDIEKELAKK